jgi:hypothetical protein
MVKYAHQTEKLIWRYCPIDIIVPEEVVGCFNQQELKDAFDDDLLEDTTSIVQRCVRI